MTKSIVKEKSFQFSIKVINLYKYLVEEKREYVMSKQILRSGTSIGANIAEAMAAQSKKDFMYKLSISLKESSETMYWIELLQISKYITEETGENLHNEANELYKILTSIIKTTREKEEQKNKYKT